MGFWLEQGLSGFRVDAVPFLIEPTGCRRARSPIRTSCCATCAPIVNRRNGEAVLLGEVNLPPKDLRTFLGDEDGDELHMVLDFLGNQALYLALARGEARAAGAGAARLPGDARRPRRSGASCATTTS